MKLPRNLSADTLIRHLARAWSYEIIRQTGSHIRLRTPEPSLHSITIPNHAPIKPGTLSSVFKEIADHKRVSVEELLRGL